MTTTLPTALIAAAISITALSAHGRTLEPQTMRDWTVQCSTKRYCVASTPGVSAAGDKMTLKLERSNKVDARIYVTTKPAGEELSLKSHISISVVGHNYRFHGTVDKVWDGNEAAFPEKFSNRSIQKLKAGRFGEITVKFGPGKKTIKYDVSLQGVTSVLAIMDVIQGRLDREDAAVIAGGEAKTLTSHYDLAAAKAPPAPAGEKTEQAKDPESDIVYPEEDSPEESGLGEASLIYRESELPSRVLMPGYRMLNCDLPATIEAFGAQVINLEPGVFLYLVPCSSADVNVPHYVALEAFGETDTVEFQVPASATGQPESLLINPRWDKALNGLTSYQYFSPNGDCGRHEKHVFSPQDNRFYLSEYRLKENCDGVTTPPGNYPIEWNGEGD